VIRKIISIDGSGLDSPRTLELRSDRNERREILDEFVEVRGYHRRVKLKRHGPRAISAVLRRVSTGKNLARCVGDHARAGRVRKCRMRLGLLVITDYTPYDDHARFARIKQ
jgi:hypothetical protein